MKKIQVNCFRAFKKIPYSSNCSQSYLFENQPSFNLFIVKRTNYYLSRKNNGKFENILLSIRDPKNLLKHAE